MADADDGILGTLRKEVTRNAVRARNGIRWAAGAEFAPPHPTPSDEVWRRGKVSVRRYRREQPARYRTPVLAHLGLVGRSYIFDLYKGGSIVEMLMEAGFDAYVLDWGVPDELDATNTLETYLLDFLPAALDAVCGEAGSAELTDFAYCMGGLMSAEALAAAPDLPVRNLVTIASPFDWHDLGVFLNAVKDGQIDVEDMVDETGNVPGGIIRQSFKQRKPTSDLVNYANLWQNLWNDRYVEGYQAIGRFLRDQVPLPRGVAEQMVNQWLRDNAFANDTLRLGGRRISLADVRANVLSVIAERDDIAPLDAALAIERALPNATVDLLRIDTGHVSLFAGRQAVKEVMPTIFSWIAAHSEVRK